jgi:hypothetical protein
MVEGLFPGLVDHHQVLVLRPQIPRHRRHGCCPSFRLGFALGLVFVDRCVVVFCRVVCCEQQMLYLGRQRLRCLVAWCWCWLQSTTTKAPGSLYLLSEPVGCLRFWCWCCCYCYCYCYCCFGFWFCCRCYRLTKTTFQWWFAVGPFSFVWQKSLSHARNFDALTVFRAPYARWPRLLCFCFLPPSSNRIESNRIESNQSLTHFTHTHTHSLVSVTLSFRSTNRFSCWIRFGFDFKIGLNELD